MTSTMQAEVTQQHSLETLALIIQMLHAERDDHLTVLPHLTDQQDRLAFRRTLDGYNRDIELIIQRQNTLSNYLNAGEADRTLYEGTQASSQDSDESNTSSRVTVSSILVSLFSAVGISRTAINNNEETLTNPPEDVEPTSEEGTQASGAGAQDESQQESRYAASDTASTEDQPEDLTCISCEEPNQSTNVAILPCGMTVCQVCLRSVFEIALRRPLFLPPLCCEQLMYSEGVEKQLTPELIQQYQMRKLEYDTLDKTYCTGCENFLHAEHIVASVGTCPGCQRSTCTICKLPSHVSECTEDSLMNLTKELADSKNWKQCNSCNAIVERTQGCNHMTCRCGYEFCYRCGRKHKTCTCPLFNYPENTNTAGPVGGLPCTHSWRKISPVTRDCTHGCPARRYKPLDYIFRCVHCDTEMCWICRCSSGFYHDNR